MHFQPGEGPSIAIGHFSVIKYIKIKQALIVCSGWVGVGGAHMEHLHRAGGGRPGGGAAGRGAALGLPEGQVQTLLLPRARPQQRPRHLPGGLHLPQLPGQALHAGTLELSNGL